MRHKLRKSERYISCSCWLRGKCGCFFRSGFPYSERWGVFFLAGVTAFACSFADQLSKLWKWLACGGLCVQLIVQVRVSWRSSRTREWQPERILRRLWPGAIQVPERREVAVFLRFTENCSSKDKRPRWVRQSRWCTLDRTTFSLDGFCRRLPRCWRFEAAEANILINVVQVTISAGHTFRAVQLKQTR